MANLYVKENWVNRTLNARTGDSDVYETFTSDVGELYRAMRKEYGRCVGRVYVERDGKDQRVGWIFLKRKKYDDCADTYLLETWVTVHSAPPTEVRREYHYAQV